MNHGHILGFEKFCISQSPVECNASFSSLLIESEEEEEEEEIELGLENGGICHLKNSFGANLKRSATGLGIEARKTKKLTDLQLLKQIRFYEPESSQTPEKSTYPILLSPTLEIDSPALSS